LRPVQRLAGACLALLVASGCQQIAGIKERKYDSTFVRDGGADAGKDAAPVAHPSEQDCDTYCGLLGESCTAENKIAAFPNDDYCKALCPKFRLAEDPSADEGNSFECRLAEAMEAKRLSADPSESTTNCQAAGPGGAGKCGSNCEGYCQLYADVCAEFMPDPECLEHCPALRDDAAIDANQSFNVSGADTLQCRLAHLSAAAVDSDPHCGHARLDAAFDTPCNPKVPSCEDYCGMLMNTCATPDVLQYESASDCLRTCRGFDKGEAPDLDLDTLACRRYHTYNSLRNPPGHCTHTGPGGDGHCGKICPAYCKLVKAACSERYQTTFVGGDPECERLCAEEFFEPGTAVKDQQDLGYTVAKGKARGNTIQCLLYHTTKAFGNPSVECPSALGLPTGDCQ
jgi:hypothetical protein